MKNAKIVAARISAMPVKMFDPMPEVWVTLEGETEEQKLFEYYPDELSFRAEEFIGLTPDEGRALKAKKDTQWLRSSSYIPVQ